MSKILSVINQKGGVGKTTTVINLATSMSAIGKKVLVVDLDPQGNASTGFGISQQDRENNIYDVLISDIKIGDSIRGTFIDKLDIIPATVDLSGAEVELLDTEKKQLTLSEKIRKIRDHYDFIFIDWPPSLGMLTINAMSAADSIIIPMQCEFFAMEGLSHLLKTFNIIKSTTNPNLEIEGIILTMYDKRNRLTEQVEDDIRNYMGKFVYDTVIPRNVRISEAPSHGKPVLFYDIDCVGSVAYINLAKEMIDKNGICFA